MADEESNPYAASDAPIAAEEVTPSRIRFYMICLACAMGVSVPILVVLVLRLPDALVWTSMALAWLVGVLWILRPELRRPGGVRNLSVKQSVVTILGVPVFAGTLMFIILVIALMLLEPWIR